MSREFARARLREMANQGRAWWRWLALAIAGVVIWQVAGRLVPHRSGTDKLINQLWVERMPRDDRDLVWHLVALDRAGHHVGVLGRSSRWRVVTDRLIWKLERNTFTIITPQNRCRSTLKVRAWKCAGQAPKPFELCLELESGGKRYRYYSRNDWGIKPNGQIDGDAELAAPVLRVAQDDTGSDDGFEASAECPPFEAQ